MAVSLPPILACSVRAQYVCAELLGELNRDSPVLGAVIELAPPVVERSVSALALDRSCETRTVYPNGVPGERVSALSISDVNDSVGRLNRSYPIGKLDR